MVFNCSGFQARLYIIEVLQDYIVQVLKILRQYRVIQIILDDEQGEGEGRENWSFILYYYSIDSLPPNLPYHTLPYPTLPYRTVF